MSLPPDPHDDDLDDERSAALAPPPPPPPPPSPPPQASGPAAAADVPTPPPSPAYATAGTTSSRETGSAGRLGASLPAAPATAAGPPGPDLTGDAGAQHLKPGARPGGRRSPLAWAVGAVVAALALAAGVVVLDGNDEDETASDPAPADEPADDPAGTDGPDTSPADPAPAGPASPVAAAEALIAAVEQGDCATMINVMTVESWGSDGATVEEALAQCQAEYSEEGGGELAGVDFGAVSLVSESGDEALVEVAFEIDGQPGSEQWPVRRVDGAWKVHLERSGGG
jgi:hypothetical protein